jgi:small membrane protein
MSLSQIVFMAFLVLMIIYIFRMRNILTDRIILIVLTFSGIIFVAFPRITVKIANIMGVGRGTDLILYLFILLCLFVIIYILGELTKLNTKFTEFIRIDAIRNAKINSNKQQQSVEKDREN